MDQYIKSDSSFHTLGMYILVVWRQLIGDLGDFMVIWEKEVKL